MYIKTNKEAALLHTDLQGGGFITQNIQGGRVSIYS